jgi:hypothetical protein
MILPVNDKTAIFHPEIPKKYYLVTREFKHRFGCAEHEMGGDTVADTTNKK